jgi:hypothetical protein
MDSNPRLVVESVTPPAFRNGIRRDRSGLCEGPQMRLQVVGGRPRAFSGQPAPATGLDRPARLSGSEIAHHGLVDALEWFDLAPGHIRWHPVGVEGTVESRFQHCEDSVGGRLAGAPRVCGWSVASERPWAGWRACCASDLNGRRSVSRPGSRKESRRRTGILCLAPRPAFSRPGFRRESR